jgi:hypothetical protein
MKTLNIISIVKNDLESITKTLQSVNHAKIPNDFYVRHLVCIGDNTLGLDRKLKLLQCRNLEIVSTQDSGLYNGMNIGLSHVKYGWVMFLNGGDELATKDSLIHIANAIAKSKCDLVQLQTQIGQKVSPVRMYSKFSLFLGREMHAHPSFIFNFNKLKDLRFDEKYQVVADYKFVLEAMRFSNVSFEQVVVVKFELGGLSSRNLNRLVYESNKIRIDLSAGIFLPLVLLWNLKVRLFSHL